MGIIIEPMSEAIFEFFREHSITDFAEQILRSGLSRDGQEVALAEQTFSQLLPEGLQTCNNYLFEIKDVVLGERVGAIWIGVTEEGLREGFIFDLLIHRQYRRKGYAKLAMLKIEEFFLTLNISSIALEVYFENAGARRLYGELGYGVISQSMRKLLKH